MTTADFLKNLDNNMAMKSGEWLENELKTAKNIILLDFRGENAWKKGHIKGSKQLSINLLPEKADKLIPSKESIVISICNGSIQSAMTTMYLRTEGYLNSYNLSGGYSSWERNNRRIIRSKTADIITSNNTN